MGKTTLTWQFDGDDPDSFEVYRDDNPMDKGNLPAPLADNLDGSDRSYEDSVVVEDETYFYRVAARVGGLIAVSDALEHTATPSSWSPLDLSPQLWLDASDNDTITVDGSDGVIAWEDKSGNSNDVSQATAGSRPILKSAEQNGLDVIRFDGSNDALVFDAPWAQAQEVNVFLAGNTTSLGASWRIFLARTPAVVNEIALYLGNNSISRQPTVYANSSRLVNGSTLAGKGLIRWAYYEDGASSWAATQINGNAETKATPVTITSSMRVSWASISTATAQQSAFDAYEIIITGPLDVNEIYQVTGYLAWKWGLEGNLPSGHPYENGPP